MRRALHWLLLAGLVLALVELPARLGFRRLDVPFPDPARHVATAADLAAARPWFDAELGWRAPYTTASGERPTRDLDGPPWLLAFGDSFTHGDEVGDAAAWPARLAARTGRRVANFGTGAYGLDQILLRARRELAGLAEGDRPEIAVFAFITWDIERDHTRYLPFLLPGAFTLTKPRFELATADDGDTLRLVANPIRQVDELERLRDPAFVAELGADDRWLDPYDLPRSPTLQTWLPRSLLLLHPGVWEAVWRSRHGWHLWREEGPRRLATAILVDFARTARAAGVRPLVVHLPVVWEAVARRESGVDPADVAIVRDLCRAHRLDCLFLSDALGERTTDQIATLYTRGRDGGHYSAAGNDWVAETVSAALGAAPR